MKWPLIAQKTSTAVALKDAQGHNSLFSSGGTRGDSRQGGRHEKRFSRQRWRSLRLRVDYKIGDDIAPPLGAGLAPTISLLQHRPASFSRGETWVSRPYHAIGIRAFHRRLATTWAHGNRSSHCRALNPTSDVQSRKRKRTNAIERRKDLMRIHPLKEKLLRRIMVLPCDGRRLASRRVP